MDSFQAFGGQQITDIQRLVDLRAEAGERLREVERELGEQKREFDALQIRADGFEAELEEKAVELDEQAIQLTERAEDLSDKEAKLARKERELEEEIRRIKKLEKDTNEVLKERADQINALRAANARLTEPTLPVVVVGPALQPLPNGDAADVPQIVPLEGFHEIEGARAALENFAGNPTPATTRALDSLIGINGRSIAVLAGNGLGFTNWIRDTAQDGGSFLLIPTQDRSSYINTVSIVMDEGVVVSVSVLETIAAVRVPKADNWNDTQVSWRIKNDSGDIFSVGANFDSPTWTILDLLEADGSEGGPSAQALCLSFLY